MVFCRPVVVLLLVLWGSLLCAGSALAQDLELRFLDVGQGDAVLIRNGGKAALVDAGPSDRIADRLRGLGVSSLDLLIASHNHADHIGGADAVLSRIPVRFYLDNGHPATTAIQSRVLGLVESRGVTYLQASARTFTLGDATIRIIPAPRGVGGDEQNNRSVVVLLERGTFKALLTGDSEVEEINALLRSANTPDVDVLKAAHHGSRNGVTPAWLARTKPEFVVISVGASNTYGHPHAAALRYYEAGGRRVLRTDRDGDVIFTVEPSGRYQTRTGRGGALPPASRAEPTPARRSPAPRSAEPARRTNAPPARARSCCRICTTGQACGDGCISRRYTCRRPPGCACDG